MGHGEIVKRFFGIECPEVDDLFAMGIDQFDGLPFLNRYGDGFACRY